MFAFANIMRTSSWQLTHSTGYLILFHLMSYEHDLIEKFTCETGSEDCWLNHCAKCSNAKILYQKYSLKESHTVVWYEWRKDKDGCLNKVEQEGLTDDLFQHICSMLPRFLEHCYVKRNQAESYNEERNMVGSHDFDPAFALIQVDFSENYTCTYQCILQHHTGKVWLMELVDLSRDKCGLL